VPKCLENVEQEIIKTTRQMILEKGYERLNIRDIAKKCGIATGTFYNYFQSKQAIITALLDEDFKSFQSVINTSGCSGETTIGRLEALFDDLRQLLYNVHHIWSAGIPDDLEGGTLNKLQSIKLRLRNEFAQRILMVIHGHTAVESEEFAADVIARIFFSYAYEKEVGFESLRFFVEKMLYLFFLEQNEQRSLIT